MKFNVTVLFIDQSLKPIYVAGIEEDAIALEVYGVAILINNTMTVYPWGTVLKVIMEEID